MVVLLLSVNVDCLQTLWTLLDIKIDCLAFGQRLEPIAIDSRKMYEDILATISGCDKSKTLGLVEPFNSTCSHVKHLCKKHLLINNCNYSGNHAGVTTEQPE